ncbi:transposase [Conexibacter sp. SYSU D00693]|uniref:transposase n=1 Tax=Conexibacter sp. SYSU D00693 TaxID=2812560 RepID=UPI00196B0AF8|nr:transposase [Conexibacter sp. SYSU D00693]
MGRPPRPIAADATYHLTGQAVHGRDLFLDGRDRRDYVTLLEKVVVRLQWSCQSFCLMPDHVHLVVRTADADIDKGMHWLQWHFARRQNARRGGHNAVFAKRYGHRLIEDERHLLEVLRYVPLNPVREGLCDDPASWRWSSHRMLAATEPAPAWLDVEAVYEAFGPVAGLRGPSSYLELMSGAADLRPDLVQRLRQAAKLAPSRPTVLALRPEVHDVAAALGSAPTDADVARAFDEHAHAITEIARHLDQPTTTVWRRIARGRRVESTWHIPAWG